MSVDWIDLPGNTTSDGRPGGGLALFPPAEPTRAPDQPQWWDLIGPGYPVTVSAQVLSRTWR